MQFIVKISKQCNLRCVYCYEYDELSLKDTMRLEDLEFFVCGLAEYLANQEEPNTVDFIIHGGEPTLLPSSYFRAVVKLLKDHLGAKGLTYKVGIQTNLYSISDAMLDLFGELEIVLGISIDVFGGQRINVAEKPTQDKVLHNMQKLLDRGIRFGAISVLHALNIDKVVQTYKFYNILGINYRVLPIFSHLDTPARMRHLMISHERTLEALKAIALVQLSEPSLIVIQPLQDYYLAAARYLTNAQGAFYEPAVSESVLIINTNGAIYSNGDPYKTAGWMGNVFQNSISEILDSEAHTATVATRMRRAMTCRQCKYDTKCNQFPLIESHFNERIYNENNELVCAIVKPMISFIIEQMRSNAEIFELIEACRSIGSAVRGESQELALRGRE